MVNFDCFDIARPPNSFFWKLCYLVTFNLRAIKKNRRGLQSHLEKEQKNRTAKVWRDEKQKVFCLCYQVVFHIMYVMYKTIT